MTNPPIVMWMGSPAKPHHLPLMRAELKSFERCSASTDPDVSACYQRAADLTREAIQELERIARKDENT